MKKRKRLNLLKLGVFLFGFSLLLWNCEKDELLVEDSKEAVISNEKIEAIPTEKLPQPLLERIFSISNKGVFNTASKSSRKQLLDTYFESSANVVTTEKGFITYSLVIKKNRDINTFLNKKLVSKKFNRNECDQGIGDIESNTFDVIALNSHEPNGGGLTAIGNPTHVSFNNINGGILRATFTNINTGETTRSYANLNNTGNWNIFKGIWTGIKGIGNGVSNGAQGVWNGIKSIGSWIGGLFKSNRTSKCPGSLAKKDDNSNNDKDSNKCPEQIEAEQSAKEMSLSEFEDKHLLDKSEAFDIPLPKELFEKKLAKTPKALTKEDFDCACDNDKPFTIAQFLELEFEQMLFLAEDTQQKLRKEICAFIRKNDYSIEAKTFAKQAIKILSDPLLPPNSPIVGYTAKIQKMIAHLKQFGNPEDEFFAQYLENLIPEFTNMTVGDVYDIYKLSKNQVDNLTIKYIQAVVVPFAEAAYPFVVYALTEATLGAALPLLARIPKLPVFNSAWVNNLVRQIGLLGKVGKAGNHIRIVTTNGNAYTKSLELFKGITQNAKSVNISNGVRIADMGNGNRIIFRPLSASKTGYTATIELDFRAANIWSRTRIIKFE